MSRGARSFFRARGACRLRPPVVMEAIERDLVGQVVDGRFRVEALLGSGGMGTVWRVEHVESLQKFALKTLDSKYATDEEATRRFLREARAAGALRTRHVVRIVDAQMQHRHQGEPLPFLVMELWRGETCSRSSTSAGAWIRGSSSGWRASWGGRWTPPTSRGSFTAT